MILIVGGAGYIGSHINKYLNENGEETIVLDNLSQGHKEFAKWGKFVECDLNDIDDIENIFKNNKIDAVMHFSAYSLVKESVVDPKKYYENNVKNTINLLSVMLKYDVNKFIFSSTCAVYGNPQELPLKEDHPLNPINTYGLTKLMVETILKDYSRAYPDFNYVSLRYFNASGADPKAEIGEWHTPESHLIPLVLDVAAGKRENIHVFGTDYETRDGTCVRDYIHVLDLAQAHYNALKFLNENNTSEIFNLGNGTGFTVKEIIDVCQKVTGCEIKVVNDEPRPGDPPILIGSSKKAKELLKWEPQYDDIEKIIKTAWDWHQKKYSM